MNFFPSSTDRMGGVRVWDGIRKDSFGKKMSANLFCYSAIHNQISVCHYLFFSFLRGKKGNIILTVIAIIIICICSLLSQAFVIPSMTNWFSSLHLICYEIFNNNWLENEVLLIQGKNNIVESIITSRSEPH